MNATREMADRIESVQGEQSVIAWASADAAKGDELIAYQATKIYGEVAHHVTLGEKIGHVEGAPVFRVAEFRQSIPTAKVWATAKMLLERDAVNEQAAANARRGVSHDPSLAACRIDSRDVRELVAKWGYQPEMMTPWR